MADSTPTPQAFDALLVKNQQLESDILIQKKRIELIEHKLTEEKENEIASLNQQFQEVLEKRKEAFMQLKEKLQQASQVIVKFQNQHTVNTKQIEELTNELSQTRNSMGSTNSEMDRSLQRITELETQLINERNTVATLNTSNSELQSEVQTLKTKLENFEDNKSTRPKASITLDEVSNAAPTLLPGLLENSRTITFKWALAGPMRIQWYRSFRGSQWEAIPGKLATRPQYHINVDDIGACLKAEATHTGTGQQVYAETGPIQTNMNMIGAVSEAIRKLDFTINCESALPDAKKDRQIQMNKEKIKIRQGNKTTHKATWSDQVRIVLDGDASVKFNLHIDAKTEPFQLAASNPRERDYFVHIIRSFVFQITRGKSITYTDHLQALALQARVLNELHKNGPVQSAKKTPAGTPKGNAPGAATGAKPNANGRTQSIGSKNDLSTTNTKTAPGTPSHTASSPNGNATAPVEDDSFAMFGLAPANPSAPGTPARKASVSSNNSTQKELNTPASHAAQSKTEAPAIVTDGNIAVVKNHGFDDYNPKDADDSDDDEPDNRQAIKVTINAEARPIADGASLRNMASGLQLTGKSKKKKKDSAGVKKRTKSEFNAGESGDFSFTAADIAASVSPNAASTKDDDGFGSFPPAHPASTSTNNKESAKQPETMDDLLDLFGAPRKASDPVVTL